MYLPHSLCFLNGSFRSKNIIVSVFLNVFYVILVSDIWKIAALLDDCKRENMIINEKFKIKILTKDDRIYN